MDRSDEYSVGICGEKKITLDSSTPSLLSIVYPTVNPVSSPFTVKFDHTLATNDDIKDGNVVKYTVELVNYSGIAEQL